TEEAWTAEAVGAAAPSWEEPASGPVFAADVPAYVQAYSLSCEYAAAYIATAGFGWGVPESAFIERIGPSANPHWGYRGNIHGAWGGTDDYGVYPEALVPTLNEFGFIGDVFYGGDPSSLTARIDAGMPVLTWLGYFGDTAWLQQDEGSYLLSPGLHVVTVYGYDDWGVYVSNPGRGTYDYYAWGDFLSMWSVLDGMALGVAPM
ncbi:MAG: Peptidoglycan-binding LysM, partial [Thermomicrobiales bacterium]|nr:Peptidoglycan-binding LysM [Thermomicrobiales bacterium]